jgi:hypothetical protein
MAKKYTYTIDDAHAVRVFVEGEKVPFWYQPDYPNGDKFDTKAEAETWAKMAVDSMDEAKPYPPSGKGLAREPKAEKPTIIPFE